MRDRTFWLIAIALVIGLMGFLWRLPAQGHAPVLYTARGHTAISHSPEIPDLLQGRKIDINCANMQELKQIPRLPRKTILAILNFRDTNGPITSLDQLDQIKGVGPKTLLRLKELCAVYATN